MTNDPRDFKKELFPKGFPLPAALDIEEAVLGALLIEPHSMNLVADQLSEPSFYGEKHRLIFKAYRQLYDLDLPIDLVTVTNQINSNGDLLKVEGAYGVTEITNRVASSAHIEYHVAILAQKMIQREVIKSGFHSIEAALDPSKDVFEIVSELVIKSENMIGSVTKGIPKKVGDLLVKTLLKIEENAKKTDLVTGVPSGFSDLDGSTSGWQAGNLIILGARPSMGKSALAGTWAINAAIHHNVPTMIFSLEMTEGELMNRILSHESGVPLYRISHGKTDVDDIKLLHSAGNKIKKAPLYIDDTASISVAEIKAKARTQQGKHGLGLIIIDYLQLIKPLNTKELREIQISTISRSLKSLAKELEIPIIALAQLSRKVEERDDKKPILSDLRESGAIEQDADIILFLTRPEYYVPKNQPVPPEIQGIAELTLAKNRNGRCDEYPIIFDGTLTKFSEIEPEPWTPKFIS